MHLGSRRRFLLASAGFGAAIGIGGAGWLAQCWQSSTISPPLRRFSRSSRALGSQVSITSLAASSEVANRAIDAAFGELETVEAVMSIYRPESQLSRLNRSGRLDSPHPYLVDVLRHAEQVSRASEGAFDVTVQPLWELNASAHKAGGLPDRAAVELARRQVDWRQVEIRPDRISLHGRGTAITLNGIAQGFAADQAMTALRKNGIEHGLVDTGEVAPLGTKEDGEEWTAGIQHPREAEAYVALARLDGRCLATSGDYATAFSPDRKYNHLFDPRTGRSPDELSSVSIAAPTAMQADALSTAVFVLGAERGLALVEKIESVDALLVTKNGRIVATPGFPQET